MSYSIWLEHEACPHCGEAPEEFSWDYTSNMSGAWRHAGADLAEFDNRPAGECAVLLEAAIERMEADPATYQAFDSPNGWGSYGTLVPALRRLLLAFAKYPNATVVVSR